MEGQVGQTDRQYRHLSLAAKTGQGNDTHRDSDHGAERKQEARDEARVAGRHQTGQAYCQPGAGSGNQQVEGQKAGHRVSSFRAVVSGSGAGLPVAAKVDSSLIF
jgi:hypothetical protein